PLPCLDGDVGERAELVEARARHDDLDRAELGPHLAERVVDGGAVGDVDLRADRLRARRAEVVRGALDTVAVEVEQRDAVTGAREVAPDGESHARGGPGDDGDAAHVSLLVRGSRGRRVWTIGGRAAKPVSRGENPV